MSHTDPCPFKRTFYMCSTDTTPIQVAQLSANLGSAKAMPEEFAFV